MNRSRGPLAALLTLALSATACGTRLPPDAFATTTGPPVTTPSTSAGPNPASDVGVTPSTITVGIVASLTSILGAEAFSGPAYGAQAFFDGLNRRGGIAGRTVRVVVCDDQSSGAANRACVQKLIGQDKVFAFVGNSIFDYAGAQYVNEQGVPDIGGQPIGSQYDTYRHLYSIYGSSSPRNGTPGFDGTLYGGTEVYRFFKERLGAKVAAVVYYNQADSQRFAEYTEQGLKVEGFDVVRAQVDFGVANWDAVAANLRASKVDVVFDALENTGNVNLCKALDRNRVNIKAKVMTVQSWTDTVRRDYVDASSCRNQLYATATELNYADTKYPVVAQFREDMRRTFPDREPLMSMWALEGWGAGKWFSDAATTCGADLTRACVEKYLTTVIGYTADGLMTPRDFQVNTNPRSTTRNCLNVARWQDSAADGAGGWVTQVDDMSTTCFTTPDLPYRAT